MATSINYKDFIITRDPATAESIKALVVAGNKGALKSELAKIGIGLDDAAIDTVWEQFYQEVFPALPVPGLKSEPSVATPSTSTAPPGVSVSTVPPPAVPAVVDDISDSDLRSMWSSIDDFDVDLMNRELLSSFEYQGFDPDAVLKSLMKAKNQNSVPRDDFLKDVTTLVALAMIKGSINDQNLKKMSDEGKTNYGNLEKRYGIKRGGAKGKSSDVVTIARIAATFPGKVIELLQKKVVEGRSFISDLGTYQLPGILRHQALAAIVPRDLEERTRTFILNLVTAFSADQSKVIGRSKSDITTIIENQRQFTLTTHTGRYPPEEIRKRIFRQYEWKALYPSILPVAQKIKTKWAEFEVVPQNVFNAAIDSLT